ncbi:MAG: Mo-dependent nitrogenase C-terminal domain-containing protein [Cyanobacteriota bacterium]
MTAANFNNHQNLRFQAIRTWLNDFQIQTPKTARFICQFIPAQCPFARDISLLGRQILHIPPLCKLNPFYEEVLGMRFRALCYLADECGEDVSQFLV